MFFFVCDVREILQNLEAMHVFQVCIYLVSSSHREFGSLIVKDKNNEDFFLQVTVVS